MNIVVDTNIFISALIKNSLTRHLIINSKDNLLFPEFEFIEIKNHLSEILEKSGLSYKELEDLIKDLLKYVKIVRTEEIINYRNKSSDIMSKIDKDDIIFIATALATDAVIWSDDKHFKKQNEVTAYTTKEINKIFSK